MFQNLRADLRREYGPRQRLKKTAALLFNPSMRACALVRLATTRSNIAYWIARNLLISTHAIDVGRGVMIGAPLILPHPMGIVLGKGSKIGDGITIYHGVTIGSKNRSYPVIGNEVTIYPNAIIVGNITVGDGAVIGAGKFIDKNVRAGSIIR